MTEVQNESPIVADDPAAQLGALLRNLRCRSKMPLDEFLAQSELSRIRLAAIEQGMSVPGRAQLHAYFNCLAPSEAERAEIRKLWETARNTVRPEESLTAALDLVDTRHTLAGTKVTVDPNATHRRGGSITYRVRTVLADSTHVAPEEQRLTLTKPAWRRSVAVSQADISLWPDPAMITTADMFKQGLLAIKESTGLSYASLASASERLSFPLARSTVHALCTKPNLPPSPETVGAFITICGGGKREVLAWKSAWQRLTQAAVTSEPVAPEAPEAGEPPIIEADTSVVVPPASQIKALVAATDERLLLCDGCSMALRFDPRKRVASMRTLMYLLLAALLIGFIAGAVV